MRSGLWARAALRRDPRGRATGRRPAPARPLARGNGDSTSTPSTEWADLDVSVVMARLGYYARASSRSASPSCLTTSCGGGCTAATRPSATRRTTGSTRARSRHPLTVAGRGARSSRAMIDETPLQHAWGGERGQRDVWPTRQQALLLQAALLRDERAERPGGRYGRRSKSPPSMARLSRCCRPCAAICSPAVSRMSCSPCSRGCIDTRGLGARG